jgi:IS30 family transposase
MQERKYLRLTKPERRSLEQSLKAGRSIKSMAAELGRSTSTISREIIRNSVHRKTGGYGSVFNNCIHRDMCSEARLCSKENCRRDYCCGCEFCFHVCKKYKRENCERLNKSPYVCNGCRMRNTCTLEKALYKAGVAHSSADEVLRNTRSGIDLTEAERRRLDEIISPLIRQGQSPYHIWLTCKDELMISEKTIYNYIAMGLFSAKSIDLFKKVKMKPRKTKIQPKIERRCRNGRTYEDYQTFIKEHPRLQVVEIDSVIGAKGGNEKVLLTMQFSELHFMLAFIRDANTARSVQAIFDRLQEKLGDEQFAELFAVCLGDNGSEFSNPSALEADKDGVIRSKIFYCDPRCSFQKPNVENNNDFIRRYIPKGTSMNHLTQRDVNLMMSHINSYGRDSLCGLTPVDLFVRAYSKGLLKKLGLKIVPPKDIILSPKIFK